VIRVAERNRRIGLYRGLGLVRFHDHIELNLSIFDKIEARAGVMLGINGFPFLIGSFVAKIQKLHPFHCGKVL
jgi:hypothetical protein